MKGARLIGDIDLFAREVKAPIVAITGSNGIQLNWILVVLLRPSKVAVVVVGVHVLSLP